MRNGKNTKTVSSNEQVQDSYAINTNKFLTLGFVGEGTTNIENIDIEKRRKMISISTSLHVVISEVLKSKDYRDNNKLLGFLSMALEASDDFYKNETEMFLCHNLTPME